MALKPCITCGRPSRGSHCPEHTRRNGSTRAWRSVRSIILARDRYACQLCGGTATEVDHIRRVADGGSDHPSNLRALCHTCHASR
jgi:5-methylcytosine-specific restriction protein A